jgi:predicted amino acid dehydrogenase
MYSREGRKVAKLAFIDAVRWAEAQGAKVILLAASTKRLFGRDGLELKQLFPQLIFTIGDNGTAQLLCADVDRAIASSGLTQPRILVIGPYGILGSAVCQHLQQQQRQLIGFGGNETYLREFAESTGIDVVHDLQDAGPVDLVVACTHSENARLTAEHIALLRKTNQKLLVVDVAEPANLDRQVYRSVQNDVIRQDAGNAWSADLSYVLGHLTAKQLMLAQGTVFGCFAEALALYHTVYREYNPTPLSRDWFDVNAFNQALVAEAFHSLRIGLPQPHCFGQPVGDWTLWQPAQPAVGEQG